MKVRPYLLSFLLLIASAATPAIAGSASNNLNVSASVDVYVMSVFIVIFSPLPLKIV
jgi:hypothetical protein